ncbi:MAG TPA: DUF72 domain-containing protein [Caulobacteraceae bacterium]|nr:DUF72 domain-containing protein [Caulobacteraceae bacterium]
MTHLVRTGIGGWVFPPWRGVFYPSGLRQADELAFASERLGAIEINATSKSLQKPATFARWAAQTPENFVFTVKGHQACTNRKVLAEAGDSVARFLGQGLTELGGRLGPIFWQFIYKAFDPADFTAFLDLLPDELGGRPLRHAVEVRHASFADPRFIALCRERGVAIVLLDHASAPLIEEATAGFAYARLVRGRDEIETGYPPEALDAWAGRLHALSVGDGTQSPREVFAFFINAGKVRAPAAAMALAERLKALD